ncbi:TetR/AcrR family transcriptional regulator [Conexibacter sp. SYSU D00693]|uniref:TetR/AcrR family transcriptional regulator n=1 Tax=Conexibacter sp. SYSU D00693 TaxID=2812560 RepID=UPI00196AC02D|nr:TetR/AcrR family transcriptional regulator [Conexibacter sp. SYSU D00693]
MLSHRHEAADPRDEAILDAARACVMAVGVRRTTAADIARRAGISRMTLYRRFPDAASVVQALMTRQFGGLLARAHAESQDRATARQRIVATTVRMLQLLDEDEVLHRILDVDPELMLPYVVERLGTFQRAALAQLEGELRAGMGDGSVRLGEPARLAAALELVVRGHVLAANAHDRALPAAVAREELGTVVDRYLAP